MDILKMNFLPGISTLDICLKYAVLALSLYWEAKDRWHSTVDFDILMMVDYNFLKVGLLYGWTLPTILIISQNASNKSCLKLKFLPKNSVDSYLYLPQGWSYRAPNICHFLNDDNVLKWRGRFTLMLNAAKSTDFIEKCVKQKLYKKKFPTRISVGACVYLP